MLALLDLHRQGPVCRTQQEFQEWSNGLAEQYGYTVKFWGAGNAMDEGRALAALSLQGQNLGFASQVPANPLHCTASPHCCASQPQSVISSHILQ